MKILSIDYSLAPEAPFPVALEQCYAVVRYAVQHAAELGVDPGRVAIGGHSAGGNLSAGVCLLDPQSGGSWVSKALILDYPPLDLLTDPYAKPRPKKAIPSPHGQDVRPGLCGEPRARRKPVGIALLRHG